VVTTRAYGSWNRLQNAIAQFKAWGDDPKTGAYAQALADLAALEVEMRRHGHLMGWRG
jgi:hypothetical protein